MKTTKHPAKLVIRLILICLALNIIITITQVSNYY